MPNRTIDKSEFVRQLGDIPAKSVVEKAAAQGIKLSVAHVYTIPSAANRKTRAGSPARLARRRGRPSKTISSGNLRARLDGLVKTFVDEVLAAVKGARRSMSC